MVIWKILANNILTIVLQLGVRNAGRSERYNSPAQNAVVNKRLYQVLALC